MNWYPWIVAAHVIGGFGFVLAHGASVLGAFRMRADPRRENIAAVLAVSSLGIGLMYPFLLLLLVAGIAAGFVGGWWGSLWIWVSIAILVVVIIVMYAYGSNYYVRLREGVGIEGRGTGPAKEGASPPMTDDELRAYVRSPRPEILATVGGIGLLAIILLMMLKPF